MKNFNTKEITGAVLNENSVVRLLADGICISNDTTQTHLNNNDLIIGPPGSGKTRTVMALCKVLVDAGWVKNIHRRIRGVRLERGARHCQPRDR